METSEDNSKSDAADQNGEIGFIDRGGMEAGDSWLISRPDGGPWSTLEIYRNRLVLKGAFRAKIYDFARDDITKIVVGGWLFSHIRICHTRQDYPPYITFSSFHLDSLVEGFRRVGYPVQCE
jgi:hypothetical protein